MNEAQAGEIVTVVKNYIARKVEESAVVLGAEIASLQKRLARIEDRPQLRYLGVWKAGTAYAESSCVTFDGSIWIAREATILKPGDGNSAWQLAVKRGRDGK